MKRYSVVITILFLLVAFALPVSASVTTTAGVKPGSILYVFDLLGEKISLFFTRDPYEKAKRLLLNADERIAEVRDSENNRKSAIRATDEFSKDISQAFKSFDSISDDQKKIGFLISFENRYKEHWNTLMSVYNKLSNEDQPVFRENLFAYREKLEKGLGVIKSIESKETKTLEADNRSNSQNIADELASTKKRLAILEQKQKPQTVTELKKQEPEKYKTLISENKTKLVEASKLLSNKNIIIKVKPSVVFIETSAGSGSGIVIESSGYVLTNAHVVTGANSAIIKFASGQSSTGVVVGRDENIDLALLKTDVANLTPATLGNSDSVEQGDSVFTFGYPLGIEGDVAFKDGTLSRRQKIDGATYLEISAQILPGNSGGPLVNQSGKVIGVNTLAIGASKIEGVLIGETLKYAIPINVAKDLIPELKNGRNIITPKYSVTTPAPSPSPTPNPSQPIIPPSVFTPAPEQKPEPIRTTISNITAKEESYGIVIKFESNKLPAVYGGHKVLIGNSSNLSDAVEFKSTGLVQFMNTKPNTTYYYQVIAKDGCTQCLSYDPVEAKSEIFSITTKPSPNPPASILNLNSSNATRDSVIVSWTTDIGTASKLEYKKEGSPSFVLYCSQTYSWACSSYTNTNVKTTHIYTISGLENDTKYEYRVTALDPINLSRPQTVSDVKSFQTLPGDKIPPSFTKLESIVYGDGVRISYQGNEPIHSKLEYSTNPDMSSPITSFDNTNDLSETSGWGDSFDRTISNLSRSVTYYYRVIIIDHAGNKTISDILNFKIPNIGSLSVSSVPFPGSTLSAGSVDAEVFKIRMTASADENIKISRFVVATASSFPPYVNCGQFEYMSLYVDGINEGQFGVIYGQGIGINLAIPVIIPAGSYKDFVIKANLGGSGGVCGFNLQTTGENKYNMDAVGMSSGVQIYITAPEPLFGPFWTIQ